MAKSLVEDAKALIEFINHDPGSYLNNLQVSFAQEHKKKQHKNTTNSISSVLINPITLASDWNKQNVFSSANTMSLYLRNSDLIDQILLEKKVDATLKKIVENQSFKNLTQDEIGCLQLSQEEKIIPFVAAYKTEITQALAHAETEIKQTPTQPTLSAG